MQNPVYLVLREIDTYFCIAASEDEDDDNYNGIRSLLNLAVDSTFVDNNMDVEGRDSKNNATS